MPDRKPPRSQRIAVAILISFACAALTWVLLLPRQPLVQGGDFTYAWLAARALFAGDDPYSFIARSPTPHGPAFFYPLPVAVVAMPLAWLPAMAAGLAFVALSTGLLAFVVTRDGWWPLLLFASGPMFRALRAVQWSPLFTAVALVPPALGVVVCKPTLAVPLIAFQQSRRALLWAVAGGAALLAVSFVLEPSWVSHWRAQFTNSLAGQYQIPILTPLGVPIALAALRWRLPEARLLIIAASVPQTGFFYDQLILFLIPRSRVECIVAATASIVAYLPFAFLRQDTEVVEISRRLLPFVIAGVYYPALAIVLRRPNTGAVPALIEQSVARLPFWLRGSSTNPTLG